MESISILDIARQEVRHNPGSPYYALLAENLLRKGQKQEAFKVLLDGTSYNSDYLTGHLILGNLYFFENQFDKAQEIFSNVLDKDPRSLTALYGLSRIAFAKGEHSIGVTHLFQLIALDPYNKKVVKELAKRREELRKQYLRGANSKGKLAYQQGQKTADKQRVKVDPKILEKDYEFGKKSLQDSPKFDLSTRIPDKKLSAEEFDRLTKKLNITDDSRPEVPDIIEEEADVAIADNELNIPLSKDIVEKIHTQRHSGQTQNIEAELVNLAMHKGDGDNLEIRDDEYFEQTAQFENTKEVKSRSSDDDEAPVRMDDLWKSALLAVKAGQAEDDDDDFEDSLPQAVDYRDPSFTTTVLEDIEKEKVRARFDSVPIRVEEDIIDIDDRLKSVKESVPEILEPERPELQWYESPESSQKTLLETMDEILDGDFDLDELQSFDDWDTSDKKEENNTGLQIPLANFNGEEIDSQFKRIQNRDRKDYKEIPVVKGIKDTDTETEPEQKIIEQEDSERIDWILKQIESKKNEDKEDVSIEQDNILSDQVIDSDVDIELDTKHDLDSLEAMEPDVALIDPTVPVVKLGDSDEQGDDFSQLIEEEDTEIDFMQPEIQQDIEDAQDLIQIEEEKDSSDEMDTEPEIVNGLDLSDLTIDEESDETSESDFFQTNQKIELQADDSEFKIPDMHNLIPDESIDLLDGKETSIENDDSKPDILMVDSKTDIESEQPEILMPQGKALLNVGTEGDEADDGDIQIPELDDIDIDGLDLMEDTSDDDEDISQAIDIEMPSIEEEPQISEESISRETEADEKELETVTGEESGNDDFDSNLFQSLIQKTPEFTPPEEDIEVEDIELRREFNPNEEYETDTLDIIVRGKKFIPPDHEAIAQAEGINFHKDFVEDAQKQEDSVSLDEQRDAYDPASSDVPISKTDRNPKKSLQNIKQKMSGNRREIDETEISPTEDVKLDNIELDPEQVGDFDLEEAFNDMDGMFELEEDVTEDNIISSPDAIVDSSEPEQDHESDKDIFDSPATMSITDEIKKSPVDDKGKSANEFVTNLDDLFNALNLDKSKELTEIAEKFKSDPSAMLQALKKEQQKKLDEMNQSKSDEERAKEIYDQIVVTPSKKEEDGDDAIDEDEIDTKEQKKLEDLLKSKEWMGSDSADMGNDISSEVSEQIKGDFFKSDEDINAKAIPAEDKSRSKISIKPEVEGDDDVSDELSEESLDSQKQLEELLKSKNWVESAGAEPSNDIAIDVSNQIRGDVFKSDEDVQASPKPVEDKNRGKISIRPEVAKDEDDSDELSQESIDSQKKLEELLKSKNWVESADAKTSDDISKDASKQISGDVFKSDEDVQAPPKPVEDKNRGKISIRPEVAKDEDDSDELSQESIDSQKKLEELLKSKNWVESIDSKSAEDISIDASKQVRGDVFKSDEDVKLPPKTVKEKSIIPEKPRTIKSSDSSKEIAKESTDAQAKLERLLSSKKWAEKKALEVEADKSVSGSIFKEKVPESHKKTEEKKSKTQEGISGIPDVTPDSFPEIDLPGKDLLDPELLKSDIFKDDEPKVVAETPSEPKDIPIPKNRPIKTIELDEDLKEELDQTGLENQKRLEELLQQGKWNLDQSDSQEDHPYSLEGQQANKLVSSSTDSDVRKLLVNNVFEEDKDGSYEQDGHIDNTAFISHDRSRLPAGIGEDIRPPKPVLGSIDKSSTTSDSTAKSNDVFKEKPDPSKSEETNELTEIDAEMLAAQGLTKKAIEVYKILIKSVSGKDRNRYLGRIQVLKQRL